LVQVVPVLLLIFKSSRLASSLRWKEFFSRKGAKAQRKPLETRQRFAPLREKCWASKFLSDYFSVGYLDC
jgi:hypothetical protein